MKRAHEGLQGYLKQLRGPGEVGSTTPQPRLPLGPDAPLPIGFRPIPTSSQRPKPTNATIVYARTAVTDSQDLGRSDGASPTALNMAEGDVVLTHRMAPATRAPLGQNVKVLSLRRLNEDMRRMGSITDEQASKVFWDADQQFKWNPDGVVNNLDGADPTNEFRDFAIANVALQGFVRFSTLPFGEEAVGHNFPSTLSQKGVRNGDHVYLVFSKSLHDNPNERHTYRFGLVLASQITTGKFVPRHDAVIKAWLLGRVVDGNQSKNMVTLCVGVAPVLAAEEGRLSIADVLAHKWLDGRSPSQTSWLEATAAAIVGPFRLPEIAHKDAAWAEKQLQLAALD